MPGWTRRRSGKGFTFLDEDRKPLRDAEGLARAKALVIPPAWQDVWISPWPNGHIQATGYDARGRLQYRYHDDWRIARDLKKFDHMVKFGHALPEMRQRLALDLSGQELSRERVLACAVRLLDLGFFRIGGEDYAEENGTYGLATMRKTHVSLNKKYLEVVFDYTAKHSKHRVQSIVDPDAFEVVAQLKARRGGGADLLAFRESGKWVDVKSSDINRYVKNLSGDDFTAKDFRTWNATILMSVGLAVSLDVRKKSEAARKRAISRVATEVSHYLGNTPAVARKSYIDPRVIDQYNHGRTIRESLDRIGVDTPPGHPATQGAIEEAVLDLLK